MKFVVHSNLPDLNEYTRACRGNKYAAASMKKNAENLIFWCIRSQLKNWRTDKPIYLRYLWIEKNRRKDKDNIAFAHKFIQDALVKAGTIPNDGWKNIVGWEDSFGVDKNRPRVEVEIVEVADYDG